MRAATCNCPRNWHLHAPLDSRRRMAGPGDVSAGHRVCSLLCHSRWRGCSRRAAGGRWAQLWRRVPSGGGNSSTCSSDAATPCQAKGSPAAARRDKASSASQAQLCSARCEPLSSQDNSACRCCESNGARIWPRIRTLQSPWRMSGTLRNCLIDGLVTSCSACSCQRGAR